MKSPFVSSIPIVLVSLIFLFGLGMVIWPQTLAAIVVPLIGAALIIFGIITLTHTLIFQRKIKEPTIKLSQSIVNILVGIVFLVKYNLSSLFISILFGIYVIISGGTIFAQALQDIREKKKFLSQLIFAAIQLILGFSLLSNAFSKNNLWIRTVGLHFISISLVSCHWFWKFKKDLQNNENDEDSDSDRK